MKPKYYYLIGLASCSVAIGGHDHSFWEALGIWGFGFVIYAIFAGASEAVYDGW